MQGVDLHTHSNISDGTLSPEQLVHAAVEKGIHTLALTDHDTMDGLKLAEKVALDLPLNIISGVEISSQWSRPATQKSYGGTYCRLEYAKSRAFAGFTRTTKTDSCHSRQTNL